MGSAPAVTAVSWNSDAGDRFLGGLEPETKAGMFISKPRQEARKWLMIREYRNISTR